RQGQGGAPGGQGGMPGGMGGFGGGMGGFGGGMGGFGGGMGGFGGGMGGFGGGMGGGGNATVSTVEDIQKKFPDEYKAAQELRQKDPAAYREKMRDLQKKLTDEK
ncbi:MAG: hypothetical protein IKQ16_07400, partial [Lentisphaeria bacterium]|nr:hypothetical protein [Lentisphaeria bacterium]